LTLYKISSQEYSSPLIPVSYPRLL
jgi:hypothetical protein